MQMRPSSKSTEEQQHLVPIKKCSKALQLEYMRVRKSLLLERGKARGLEDETDQPMNVHRWRFFEFPSPELTETFNRSEKIKLIRDSLQEKSAVPERHLQQSDSGKDGAEMTFWNEALKEKSRLLQ
jgi:hypothetical protein